MIEVLYEDRHILVVVKPPGVPSQGDKTGDLDMLTMCDRYLKESSGNAGKNAQNAWLVHRLDRPVGGVMAFAKTREACTWLSAQIQSKTVVKQYIAVVDGMLDGEGVIQDYLLKNQRKNISRVVQKNTTGAKEARLWYRCMCSLKDSGNKNLSLIMITLETGRHHQIRVQMANKGHPIFGDAKYNAVNDIHSGRQELGLWSYSLSIPPMILGRRTRSDAINVMALPVGYPFSIFDKLLDEINKG